MPVLDWLPALHHVAAVLLHVAIALHRSNVGHACPRLPYACITASHYRPGIPVGTAEPAVRAPQPPCRAAHGCGHVSRTTVTHPGSGHVPRTCALSRCGISVLLVAGRGYVALRLPRTAAVWHAVPPALEHQQRVTQLLSHPALLQDNDAVPGPRSSSVASPAMRWRRPGVCTGRERVAEFHSAWVIYPCHP